jgi:hypothetical protein
MEVSEGNVKILANPLTANTLFHFIGSQNMWIGANVPGSPLQLDGYVANSIMSTEIDQGVETEQP